VNLELRQHSAAFLVRTAARHSQDVTFIAIERGVTDGRRFRRGDEREVEP